MADKVLEDIADYVSKSPSFSELAYKTARLALFDSMGCAMLALKFPDCVRRLGPHAPDTFVPGGCRVPGTQYILDPVQGAFNIGCMIRWLDYNDTWLGKEWAHPSDNLGGLLAVADYLKNVTIRHLLESMIQAYEIQGVLALSNSFNAVGIDHVILVKAATSAVCTKLLGGTRDEIINALSNAFADGGPLRIYRHAPNTGPRKSWAAGDQTSRGVWFALMARKGEMAYPQVLTAPKWGLNDVVLKGHPLHLSRELNCYIMENILFKVAFPAEFHAQTVVEGAIQLHPQVKDKIKEIERIEIETHDSAMRIIVKSGPLKNPADRDHCLQYMAACGLLFGHLKADHYEDDIAANPLLDELRSKMFVKENLDFSHDYHDPEKRSIANSIEIFFKDGSKTPKIVQEYPLGHKRRRGEGIPLLIKKFEHNVRSYPPIQNKIPELLKLFDSPDQLDTLTVNQWVNYFLPSQ